MVLGLGSGCDLANAIYFSWKDIKSYNTTEGRGERQTAHPKSAWNIYFFFFFLHHFSRFNLISSLETSCLQALVFQCDNQVNVKIITHSGGKFGDAWGVWGGGGWCFLSVRITILPNQNQTRPNQHQTKNHHGGPRGLGAAPVVVVVVCVLCVGGHCKRVLNKCGYSVQSSS